MNFNDYDLLKHSAIVVHASATKPSMDIGVKEIREWHLARNFNDIGYHLVIRRDGTYEHGRDWGTQGAHALGFNRNPADGKLTFGICMVGGVAEYDHQQPEDNFTQAQWESLNKALKAIMEWTNIHTFYGHNELPGHESRGCPCFDTATYREWFLSSIVAFYLPDDWYKHDWKDGIVKDWNEVNLYKEINVDYGGAV